MTLGELFLEAMSTGVITTGEMAWVTARQDQFTRTEEAVVQRSRLVDEGAIRLGCHAHGPIEGLGGTAFVLPTREFLDLRM